MFRFILSFLLVFLFGCETYNPYNNYYKSYFERYDGYGNPLYDDIFIFLKEGQEPSLYEKTCNSEEQVEDTILNYLRNGFWIVGASEFTRTRSVASSNLAISKAKEIGATRIFAFSRVLEEVKYKKKVRLPTYSSTDSNTYANASAYSNNIYNYKSTQGYANANTNSYTSGYTTTLVDDSYLKYSQGAVYFAKIKEDFIKFGAGFKAEIPSDLKAAIGTDKGLYVNYLIKGSPAFKADVLEGDIILTANGIDVYDNSFIDKYKGRTVLFKIYRNGNYIEKAVVLNP